MMEKENMWKKTDDSKVYSSEEVKKIIEALPHKIFYISGPTRTGKTLLVKSLQVEDKLVLGSGSFQEIIIEMCQNKEISAIDGLLSAFEFYRLLCIEDVDIILTGRTCTQELVSEFLENYLKNGTAVFTGVKLDKYLDTITKTIGMEKLVIFTSVE